jgi:hypothetical protein
MLYTPLFSSTQREGFKCLFTIALHYHFCEYSQRSLHTHTYTLPYTIVCVGAFNLKFFQKGSAFNLSPLSRFFLQ